MTQPIKFALKFLVLSALLILIFYRYGEAVLTPILPIFKWQMHTLDPSYEILNFGIENLGSDRVLAIKVRLAQVKLVGGQFVVPNPQGVAQASSITGHVWQISVLLIALVLAWPATYFTEYFVRLMISMPILLGVLMLNTPLALLAALMQVFIDGLELDTFSWLVEWNHFLEGGGRLALGLAGGVFIVWLAKWVVNLANKIESITSHH